MQVHVLHLNSNGHPVFATLDGVSFESSVEDVIQRLRALLGADSSSLRLHHYGARLSPERLLHEIGIHDGDILVAVASDDAESPGDIFLQPYGALPNSTALKEAVHAAHTAMLHGAVPHIAAEGAGGTYFLPSSSFDSVDDEQQRYSACFKPRDEELGAPANPRGRTGTGHMGVPLAERDGFYVGEAFVREAAAYVLDQLWGGHACVPPTTLVEARHPSFSNIVHPYVHKVDGVHAAGMEPSAAVPKLGSFQLFVNDAEPMCEYGPRAFTDYEVQKLALFDLRTMNSDRNDENVLFQTKSVPVEHIEMLDADAAIKASSSGVPLGPFVNPWSPVEHETGAPGTSATGKLKAVKVTIPLDHGLTLPDRISVYRGDWMWSSWAQCKKPLHPVLRRSLEEWDVERDIRVLRALFGPKLRPAVYQVLRTTHAVLKACILEGGMTLAETAVLMGRKDMDQPSSLERIIAWAKDRAKEQVHNDLQGQQQRVSMSVAFAPAAVALGPPLAALDSQASLTLTVPAVDCSPDQNGSQQQEPGANAATERPEIGHCAALTTHSAPSGSHSPAFGLFSPDSPGLQSAGSGGKGGGSTSVRGKVNSSAGFLPSAEVSQPDGNSAHALLPVRPAHVSVVPPVLPSIPEGSPSHSVLSTASSSLGTETPAAAAIMSAHSRALTQAVHGDIPQSKGSSTGILDALSAHVDRLSANSSGGALQRASGTQGTYAEERQSMQALPPVVDLGFAGRLCALSAAQAGGAVPGRKRPRTVVMQGLPVLQCVAMTAQTLAAACAMDGSQEEQVEVFVGLALSTDPALVGSRRHVYAASAATAEDAGTGASAATGAPLAHDGLMSLFEIGPMELAMSVGVSLLGRTTGQVGAASAVALGKGVGFANAREIAEAIRAAVSAAAASFRAHQSLKQRQGLEEESELQANDTQSFKAIVQSVYGSLRSAAPLPCARPAQPETAPMVNEALARASGVQREGNNLPLAASSSILQPFARASSYHQSSPSRQGSTGGFMPVAVRSPYLSRTRTISRVQTSSFDLHQPPSIGGRTSHAQDGLQLQDQGAAVPDATDPLASSSTPLTSGSVHRVFTFAAAHVDGRGSVERTSSLRTESGVPTGAVSADSPSASRTRTFTLDASNTSPEHTLAPPAVPRSDAFSVRGLMMQRQASLRRVASGLTGDSQVPGSPGNPSVPLVHHPVIRRNGSSNLSRVVVGSTGSLSSTEGVDGAGLPPLQVLIVAAGPLHLSAVAEEAATLAAQAGSVGVAMHTRVQSTGSSSGRVGPDSGSPQMRARDDPLVAAHVAAIAVSRELGVKTGATALRAARLVPSQGGQPPATSTAYAQAAAAGANTSMPALSQAAALTLALPSMNASARQPSVPEALSPVPAMLGRTDSEAGFMGGALWEQSDAAFTVPAAFEPEEAEEQEEEEDLDRGEDASTSEDEAEEEQQEKERTGELADEDAVGHERRDSASYGGPSAIQRALPIHSAIALVAREETSTLAPAPSEESTPFASRLSSAALDSLSGMDSVQDDGPPLYVLTATLSHCRVGTGGQALRCSFDAAEAAAPALRSLKHAWKNSKSADSLQQQATPRLETTASSLRLAAGGTLESEPAPPATPPAPLEEEPLPASSRTLKPSPVLAGGGLKRVGAFAAEDTEGAALDSSAVPGPVQTDLTLSKTGFAGRGEGHTSGAAAVTTALPALVRSSALPSVPSARVSAAEGLLGQRTYKIMIAGARRGPLSSMANGSASKSGLRRQASHAHVGEGSFDLGGSLRLYKTGQVPIGAGRARLPAVGRSASLVAGDGSGLNALASTHAHASTVLADSAAAGVVPLPADPVALQARQEELSLLYLQELVKGYINGVQRKKAKQAAAGGNAGR